MKRERPQLDLTPYQGQWVALDPKTHVILSHAPSLEQAEKQAKRRGAVKPLLLPVAKSKGYFVGLA